MPTGTKTGGNGRAKVGATKEATPGDLEAPAVPPKPDTSLFKIERLHRTTVIVPIVGVTPLIVNAWSQKAKEMMLANMQQETKTKTKKRREPRDPAKDYQNAFHRLADGSPGFPAAGFKAAIGAAARFFDGITMVALKPSLFVVGEGSEQLVRIIGDPMMREDTVRNATGVADLRYRPEFTVWSARLEVVFLPTMIDVDSVVALIDASGNCGVGEWRPTAPKSLSGSYGQYAVPDDAQIEVVEAKR